MAAFSTMVAAENRAKAKKSGTGDGTWIDAFACRAKDGTIGVRVLRKMVKGASGDAMGTTETRQSKSGAWDTLFDDSQV